MCVQFYQFTVLFNSVRQSRVTGPSKLLKCHVGHGNFYKVPKSFCDLALKYKNFFAACGAKLRKISKCHGEFGKLPKPKLRQTRHASHGVPK